MQVATAQASAQCRIHVNLETKEKMHITGRGHACPEDGYVCFRNSELLTGRVGKATLGGGNKAGLFQVCWFGCLERGLRAVTAAVCTGTVPGDTGRRQCPVLLTTPA